MTLNTRQAPAIESTKQNQPGESQGGNQSSYFQWCKLNLLRSRNIPPVPQERQVSREYGANFASLITFQWVAPIVKLGYKRELEIQDIWTVNPTRSVSILSDRLDEALSARLARGGRQPLAWALYDTLKPGLWVGISCQVLSMCLLVLAPFVLRHIIEFAMGAYISQHNSLPGPNLGKGMGLVIGLVAMQLVQSLSSNQAFYQSLVAGGELKAVLTPKVFSKAMRLSGRARVGNKTGYSDGRITTLMAVDLSRLEKGCAVLHILCATPTALIIALITLLVNIGYSALAGYAFLVAMTCLLTFAVRSIIIRRRAINTITDKRVSLTQEILQNVRFIKFFAWENSFLGRLRTTRKLEIDLLRRFLATRHSITVSFTTMANFASLLSFMTYALSGHRLSTDRIFASLAVFNAIRLPLSMMNIVVTSTTDAVTSLNRLQEFLLAEERQDFITWDRNMEKAFEFEKASFEWESMPDVEVKTAGVDSFPVSASGPRTTSPWDGASKPVSETTDKGPFRLMDIDFQASRRELIAVIGAIGSGKSSVLGALAGEMRLTAGSVRMSTTPAFCPQYAWMQNTTIRNNILFGQQYDEVRYNQVIDACALRPDLATFLDGDQTEIGEQGITLSGGQKQRLNIARAIYSNSDIILLDDPLSAVDADVGLHIMNQAICGLLKARCRILVTHQLQFLAHCDRIVVMEAGRIVDIGTFEHLVQKNEVLQSLVSVHHHEKEETPGSPRLADAVQLREAAPKPKVTNRNAAPLMKEEERVRHARRRDIWRAYAVSSGSIANIFIVLALAVLSAGGTILSGVWLSFWVSNKFPQLSLGQYLGIYAGITGAQAAILYLFSVYVTTSAANASKAILEDAMYRVLRAPTSFFDTTPLGRIINRFSKDVQILDNELGETVRLFLYLFLIIVAIMVLVIVYFHYFALAVGPLVAIVIFVTIYHRSSAQSLKRHEAVLRSVVFARFNEAITGVACIRAYSMEGYFRQSIGRAIDSMNAAYFLIFANQRWLSVRLDLVCNTLLLVTGALVVTSRFDVSPSISGLILSYMLSISQTLQFSIRQYTELEQHINSAERLHHYGTSLEEEKTDPLRLVEVSNTWPEQGQITFENVQMRYRDELPLVLRGLTVSFRSGERIGVVGRTGAGKSSIVSALFRLTELSGGNIRIDGVDISTIALHDLRSRLAIIPQDPTLFRGTIRSNLDPFNQYTDLELWSALREAHLVGSPPEAPSDGDEDTCEVANEKAAGVSQLHLDTQVDEFGHNLSLGQRQLMALARAIVRDSRIVICDEATSSLDYQTDQKVQQTISSFHGKTLFCIAHRLRTIIHYDRICVMDKGCIAELDTPVRLWEQQGIFREMCNQSGITRGELERGPLGL